MATADSTLDMVEEEIRRAEQLLARDIMSTNEEWSSAEGRIAPEKPRVSPSRRQEVLAMLSKERASTRPKLKKSAASLGVPKPAAHKSKADGIPKAERDKIIQQLLAERQAKLQRSQNPGVRNAEPGAEESTAKTAEGSHIHVSRSGSIPISQAQVPEVAPETSSAPARNASTSNPAAPAAPAAVALDPAPQRPSAAQMNSPSSQPSRKRTSTAARSRNAGIPPSSPMRWSTTRKKRFSRRTKEDVRREAEAKLQKECTFRPKINSGMGIKSRVETRAQRFERLTTSRARQEQRLSQRRAERRAAAMKDCTFAPEINKKSRRHAEKRRQAASMRKSSTSRLHHEADQRAVNRQRLKRQVEQQELESFPFRPSINPRSKEILDMTAYKPIHKRVNEIQRAKHANRQRDKIAQETSDPDLTFQPAINPISKQLVEARRIENDDATAFNVTARLMKDASESKARTLKLQEEYQKRESENNRYHPNISEASKALVNDMGDFARSDGNSFVRRQEILEEKKKKRQKARIAKMRERSECTFRPDTGSATAVLSHTRPHRLRESELERVERLYAQDRNAREQKKLSMAERYYNQFTFKPKINAISSGLAKSKTVEELVENQKNRHIKEQVAAKREREIRRQCTFKPKVNDSRRAKEILAKLPESQFRVDVHNPDKMVAAINAYRRDREVKLRQTRQEIEYEEMKECTFTPDVRPGHVPKQSGPVVVRGLGRYLELKDLARRLDDEKRAREKQAFKVQGVTHGGKKRGPTIPKPFKLSTTSGKENARRRALIDRVEAEKMKECTFQPKTTEARNRQLIEQILADDSDLYRD